ncbi:MAG: acetoacetate decarboxylase family protein [Acidimicrobiia bacterium]|nr:acetoacetate decarboxylase family protein [Acidimicrobiia bacterium]
MPADPPPAAPYDGAIGVEDIHLPVHIRSATQASATWLVDADVAQAIVAPTTLSVARVGPGGRRSAVTLAAVQYADGDLGPYHEVALAFSVRSHDAPDRNPPMRAPVTYIHRLPVNAEFTCAAGRQIWGFPKWVATIDIQRRAANTRVLLVDDGQVVLGADFSAGWVPLRAQELTMSCYAMGDGVLRRTRWSTTSHGARLRPGGSAVEVGDDHPMAAEIEALEIHRRSPMFTMSTRSITAVFEAPEVIGAVAPATR